MDLNVRYTSLSDSCMYNFKKHFGEFSLPQHVSIGVSRVTRPLKTNHSDHHIICLYFTIILATNYLLQHLHIHVPGVSCNHSK